MQPGSGVECGGEGRGHGPPPEVGGCLRAEIGLRVGVCWDWGWQWQLAVRLHQNSSDTGKNAPGSARPYITMRDAPAFLFENYDTSAFL